MSLPKIDQICSFLDRVPTSATGKNSIKPIALACENTHGVRGTELLQPGLFQIYWLREGISNEADAASV
jgi:hypothetical protein